MAKKKATKKRVVKNKKVSKKKTAKEKVMGKTKLRDALLIELGTEELPPKELKNLSKSLGENLYDLLCDAGLIGNDVSDYRIFATPRRLAVLFPGVDLKQKDRESFRSGPKVEAAYDSDGRPTKAAEGFARSLDVSVEDLEQRDGRIVGRPVEVKGELARELIPNILKTALKKLPIPKRMRWGDLDVEFVRPVHWLVLLHGDKVVPTEVLSVKSGRSSMGHRFHHPKAVKLNNTKEYVAKLKKAYVLVDFETRQKIIRSGVEKLASKAGGKAVITDALLDEVTSLVEWPVPLLADFEKGFLDIPAEALITTMQDNQKYFPVVSRKGKLLPHFITVSNIRSKQPKKVKEGNERVIRARFSDAEFFWNNDLKFRMDSRIKRLRNVIFHNKLGTQFDRINRISKLSVVVAEELGTDVSAAERAGILSKADLLTGMVGEFPGLQGIMGRYYAAHDGEPEEVAAAMEEQYLPRFAGDQLPKTDTGTAVAIADKLDTIVGIFRTGEIPTGDKDPFALRRAALGVLRIIIENKLDLNLWTLLRSASVEFAEAENDVTKLGDSVYDFMMDRLRVYYTDAGISVDVFEAVRACKPARPYDFDKRVRAVMAFRKLKEAASLTAANKRIRNILKKAGDADRGQVSEELLQESAEKNLASKIKTLSAEITPLFNQGDYTTAMKKLAALRPEVDDFFDNVMVMVDDETVRDNRLALLNSLSQMFLRVADLSRLQD